MMAGSVKRVVGVDVVPSAVKDAENNAALNGLTNTRWVCGKAEEVRQDELLCYVHDTAGLTHTHWVCEKAKARKACVCVGGGQYACLIDLVRRSGSESSVFQTFPAVLIR